MTRYVLKRLLALLLVVLGVVFLVFAIVYFTPGDPARLILGEQATNDAVARLRDEMGLNDNFFLQFSRYIIAALHGDFGRSYVTRRPVVNELLQALPYTLQLAAASVLLALLVGVPLGVLSSIKQHSWLDNIVTLLAMFGISVPVFWIGLLLILFFSVYLGLFPPSGGHGVISMVLPVVSLAASTIAVLTRMTRSSMLEVVRQDYIRTARAKGASSRRTIVRHALPNALIPVITVAGIQFGYLLGGAVLTETVFSIPGLGRLIVSAVQMRDYPMVEGSVLLIAVSFSLVNLIVDLLYALLNPKIRSLYR